jgi:hypothetical protein
MDRASGAESGLYIVTGIPFDPAAPSRTADCFGTGLTLLHPFDLADFPGLQDVPGHPWLWRNVHGAFMLSFNLAGFVERFLDARDAHGRLPVEDSTLYRLGVLGEPLLNQYFFALLAAVKGLSAGAGPRDPSLHVLPPLVVLSHDCDQLRGNDLITQATRLYRFLAPLKRLRFPAFSNIRHIIENALFPRKYYFDDALAMSAAERRYGFRSAFYFLNGRGGRLGARSGSAIVAEFARQLPGDAEIGVHYNYRYIFDHRTLAGQIREIEGLTGRQIRSGRAHYLVFDPNDSFSVLDRVGLQTDESMGFAGLNGFRLGFAGAFRTWCGLAPGRGPMIEIPLHFMDANMAARDDAYDTLRMVGKVEMVGGVVTILYHPGSFDTPEAADLRGVYESLLAHFAERGYRCMLPSEVAGLLNA